MTSKRWTEILCMRCGGNGVVPIPGGVSVCDHCEGRCYEPQSDTGEAADNWQSWGIIEIAVRNVNVKSYMDHWEERALKAEALIEQEQQARLTEVEHWVTRYNELDKWRVATTKRADAAEARLAALTSLQGEGPQVGWVVEGFSIGIPSGYHYRITRTDDPVTFQKFKGLWRPPKWLVEQRTAPVLQGSRPSQSTDDHEKLKS